MLTAFSVIILPLTLIASCSGMNVALPRLESTGGVLGSSAAMLVVLVVMVSYFRYRDWL